MHQFNIFSGAFSDETGQRFLKVMNELSDGAFDDLYSHSMPSHPKRYRDCLDRVASWEPTVLSDEFHRAQAKYPDIEECFKHVYVAYVKAMRGGSHVKLMVNLPKFQDFMHAFFINMARHQCIKNARYFQQSSLLEQRVVCLDALRDSLFEFLGEEHVKLDETVVSAASSSQRNRPVAALSDVNSLNRAFRGPTERNNESVVSSALDSQTSSANKPQHDTIESVADDISLSASYRDDTASKVVSNVLEPEESIIGSDNDTLGPDDSVSNVDFADKQRRAMQKFINAGPTIPEEDTVSDRSSRTSMSLSSISISQNGIVPKHNRRPHSDAGDGSWSAPVPPSQFMHAALPPSHGMNRPEYFEEANMPDAPFDRMSEISMRSEESEKAPLKKGSNKKLRSPVRSYVTHLTEDL